MHRAMLNSHAMHRARPRLVHGYQIVHCAVQVVAPHLTSVADQQQDMFLGYHTYAEDLAKKRAADARAAARMGCLLPQQRYADE